jgi:hypothetical protein
VGPQFSGRGWMSSGRLFQTSSEYLLGEPALVVLGADSIPAESTPRLVAASHWTVVHAHRASD